MLTKASYQLNVEALKATAIAKHDEVVIARSTAPKLMHETRAPATVYFPKSDILAEISEHPSFRTFCPFKGTATYWDVKVGDHIFERGAWSYEHALSEAAEIEGYLSFSSQVANHISIDEDPAPLDQHGNISGPTVDWMLRQAWQCQTPEALLKAFAERLMEDGVAVYRIAVLIWSLHPQIVGRRYVWQRDWDEVSSNTPTHSLLNNPAYTNSPISHVANGLGGVRQRLTDAEWEFNYPVMEELRDEGATDYVAMPLFFSSGQINVMSLASDHPDGFNTANLGLVFEISPVLSRYLEVFSLQANAKTLLSTYLGPRTADRVLGGEIKRGDGEAIKAGILFCDLRHSTRLGHELDRDTYLGLLNAFLEATTVAVRAHQGEVLKYIGDAALAVFHATNDPATDFRSAIAAAADTLKAIRAISIPGSDDFADCVIGIAYGEVTYGNIGAEDRLDFTVIGDAANLAARLGDLGKVLERRVLISCDNADLDTSDLEPMGDHALRNVPMPVPVHAFREVGKQHAHK